MTVGGAGGGSGVVPTDAYSHPNSRECLRMDSSSTARGKDGQLLDCGADESSDEIQRCVEIMQYTYFKLLTFILWSSSDTCMAYQKRTN